MRLLVPEAFGRFTFVQAGVALLPTFLGLRLGQVVLRFKTLEPDSDEMNQLRSWLSAQTLLFAVSAILVASVLRATPIETLLATAQCALNPWMVVQTRLVERQQRYKSVAVAEFASVAVSNAIAVGFAVAYPVGALVLFSRQPLRVVIQSMLLTRICSPLTLVPRHRLSLSLSFVRRNVGDLWSDSLFEQAYERGVLLFAGSIVGERELGSFAQARTLAALPIALSEPLTQRLVLRRFTMDPNTLPTLSQKLAIGFAFLGLLAAAVAAGLGPPVISYVFGEKWDLAGGLLVPLAFVPWSGFQLGLSKSAAIASRSMTFYLRFVRTTQFLAFGVCVSILLLTHVVAASQALAWAYTAGLTAAALAALVLRFGRRFPTISH
ncbi:MAG: oligosaccharide flippase family protein [Myxococcota bacterium]